jgi:hypothetical protein
MEAVFVPEGPPIVALHEVPGTEPPEKDRPVGYGVIRAGVRTSLFRIRSTNGLDRVDGMPG